MHKLNFCNPHRNGTIGLIKEERTIRVRKASMGVYRSSILRKYQCSHHPRTPCTSPPLLSAARCRKPNPRALLNRQNAKHKTKPPLRSTRKKADRGTIVAKAITIARVKTISLLWAMDTTIVSEWLTALLNLARETWTLEKLWRSFNLLCRKTEVSNPLRTTANHSSLYFKVLNRTQIMLLHQVVFITARLLNYKIQLQKSAWSWRAKTCQDSKMVSWVAARQSLIAMETISSQLDPARTASINLLCQARVAMVSTSLSTWLHGDLRKAIWVWLNTEMTTSHHSLKQVAHPIIPSISSLRQLTSHKLSWLPNINVSRFHLTFKNSKLPNRSRTKAKPATPTIIMYLFNSVGIWAPVITKSQRQLKRVLRRITRVRHFQRLICHLFLRLQLTNSTLSHRLRELRQQQVLLKQRKSVWVKNPKELVQCQSRL